MSPQISRRDFLEFFGRGALTLAALPTLGGLSACLSKPKLLNTSTRPFTPLSPTSEDQLSLVNGLQWKMISSYGDALNSKGETFGFNNDYLAYFPLSDDGKEGLLWSNHESTSELFVSNYDGKKAKTPAQVAVEMASVGGSIVHIRESQTGQWSVIKDSKYNRRLDAKTKIKLASERPIMGATVAMGTLANCAGGVTPWGHVLTCEENYQDFYGDVEIDSNGERRHLRVDDLQWFEHFPNPPEHYGWVVEVNPKTGDAKKLISLGRFAHEGATVVRSKNGKLVVYMGDDKANQFLYKFISSSPDSLERGHLYAADIRNGRWLLLDRAENKLLRDTFKDQTDVLIYARKAAQLLGATPLARPEDIEIDPLTGHVYVCLTNNARAGNLHGEIMKVSENNGDYTSTEFQAETFLAGGESTGFSCPDNLVFDRKGNLWMTSDMSGSVMGKGPYAPFKNNSLFYIPMSGPAAGKALRVATAPVDAELTGPTFSPDGRTLFLSVQHPGEVSKRGQEFTSHWPNGGREAPKPSVVAISGPLLDSLVGA